MKRIVLYINLFVLSSIFSLGYSQVVIGPENPSIDKVKTVRVNFHFMLNSNGTGNFDEYTDGDGKFYSGYDYARDMVQWLNGDWNASNVKMNLPIGNNTPVLKKNLFYILDACYFWRNDAYYHYGNSNIYSLRKDKDSVFNIFLTYQIPPESGEIRAGGYAGDGYTEIHSHWQTYLLVKDTPWKAWLHGGGGGVNHEILHTLGLSHTVMWSYGEACPTGCKDNAPIHYDCDDGCDDTPTAWEIMQSVDCEGRHPACGWNDKDFLECSNNAMEYTGGVALTPCQIKKIHASLDGKKKPFLKCMALSRDLYLDDIGYPKVSYFGRNISIGKNTVLRANVVNMEEITIYFSKSVEFSNFEVTGVKPFEVVLDAETCHYGYALEL